jgi:uncharacterized Ntn-hydrolase superfamily protein
MVLTGAVVLGLSACESGPECLDYTTQVIPHTTIVNGKLVSGTSIVTTCVKYAEREGS